MATECTKEAIQQFLAERGGRVKNVDLIQHFSRIFPDDPRQKTVVRETFKSHVDSIAFVKVENGVKLVCLKKQYRRALRCAAADDQAGLNVGDNGTSGQCAEPSPIPGEGMIPPADHHTLTGSNADRPDTVGKNETPQPLSVSQLLRTSSSASCTAEPQETLPGSGYGNDSEVKAPPVPHIHISSEKTPEGKSPVSPCAATLLNRANKIEMGNRWSSHSEKTVSIEWCSPISTDSAPDIPTIAVIEASPLPVDADGSMFIVPGMRPRTPSTGTPNNAQQMHVQSRDPRDVAKTQADNELIVPVDESQDNHVYVRIKHGNSTGSQDRHVKWGLQLDDDADGHDGGDEGHLDLNSMSEGEECTTPRASRQNFIELMMDSSPQVRRTMVLRNASFLSARATARSDGDSASLASSNADDDGPAVTLDPLEHEWMMCTSDGEWDSLLCLLTSEPMLILKKDFVTGFNCLHWAAKQGKPELLALMVNFAKRHHVPVDVNTRSSAGYTPLHLAAMHNHMEVVKLLVGAYDADVEVRDYSGKKASQYLTNGATVDIRDIIGAYGSSDADADAMGGREGVRWRLSKVLQPHLRPLRLLSSSESDVGDHGGRPRIKPLRRMSSLSRVRPKLQKLRDRTSQIVHSTSFREMADMDFGPSKSRPKSDLIHDDPAH